MRHWLTDLRDGMGRKKDVRLSYERLVFFLAFAARTELLVLSVTIDDDEYGKA